ncbi:MAG: hypothetical protein R3C19_08935 [Planctomycetaceae bacterium]
MSFQRLTILTLLVTAVPGCALFRDDSSGELSLKLPFRRFAAEPEIDANAPTRKVVHLDASVVVQPAADQTIRELAWEELDESGLMDPRDRQRLNEAGFRVGASGMTLPWAVASLVDHAPVPQQQRRTTGDVLIGRKPDAKPASRFGSPVAIPEGSDSVILLNSSVPGAAIPDTAPSELQQLRQIQDGRCLLHVEVASFGEGWVVLKFQPQIHFGSSTNRYSIEQGREQMAVRQNVIPLYEQQFEVKLHTNEAVVVGYRESADWTIGKLFFRSETLTSAQEHLLVLRLAGVEEVVGQKELNVQYSKY